MTTPILSELLHRTTALRGLARELVGEAHADDIVQETAIQTMTAPPQRSGPTGGWLAAVVRNLASKHRRAERVRHGHEVGAARPELAPPDRSAEDADTLRRLTEIVTSLPEPYRGTILARYLREQTPSEIAAATGTPVRTVKTRRQRGLAMLRDRLEAGGGDWRASLAGAFALDHTPVSSASTLLGTKMKLGLTAAVLLPISFAIWSYLPDSAETANEIPTASRGATADAGISSVPVGSGTGTTPSEDPANREAGMAGAARSSADQVEHDTSLATSAAGPDMAAPDAPPLLGGAEPAADTPLMRLDVVGPAAFRAAFLPTKLGGLFASEEGERLWRPLLMPAEQIWRQWDGGDDFEGTRQRVLDYAGRIRVLWMVEPGEGEERDEVFGVFALETDGATDLTALAGDLSRAMQSFMPSEPTEQSVGAHQLQLLGSAGGGIVTLPMVIEGSLVAFFGEAASLDQTVPRSLRALAGDIAQPSAPLSLDIDLTQLKGLAGVRGMPPLVKVFGLESLRSLHAAVRPNGAHAELEVEVEFGPGSRGAIAAFLPAVSTLPSLLARIPAEATPWLTLPFRPDVLFRAGVTAEAEYKALGVPGVSGNLRQDLHDEFGLYLDTELLDHLGGEVMVLGDLWQTEDPAVFERGGTPPLGACIAFSLKDTAAFARGFDKLLGHLRGVVHQYETREVDGVQITRLGSIFLTGMHMAVGQDLFAMAFGAEGVAQLEALVAGGRPETARPLPAAVQGLRHLAPAGWNGTGLADLTALLGGQVTLALEAADEFLPPEMRFGGSVGETQEWLDALLPLIADHELENVVTMTGYEAGHWRLRVVW